MNSSFKRLSAVVLCWCVSLMSVRAGEESGTYRILGLGTPDRQDELREALKAVPEVQLASLDYDKAQVTLRYDVTTLFPGFNPKKPPTAEAIDQRLDERVRGASQGSFSVKPLSAVPREQLQKVEIKILIPDCKGCRLGTYYSIAKIDGVEQVNVIKEPSQVTALIDAMKTNREALVEALKKARVGFPPE